MNMTSTYMKALAMIILMIHCHPVNGWSGTILHLNSYHGALVASDGHGGFATLKTYIDQERSAASQAGTNFHVFGSGDSWGSSQALSNLLNEKPSVIALNELLDGDSLGNNQFDTGAADLSALLAGAEFKVSADNIVQGVTGLHGVQYYDGGKLAFVGLMSDEDLAVVSPSITVNLTLVPTSVAAASSLAAARGTAEFVVAGVNMRLADSVSPGRYAHEQLPGYDLVLAGSVGLVDQRYLPGAPRVMSSAEAGESLRKITVVNNVITGSVVVDMAAPIQPSSSAELQLDLWTGYTEAILAIQITTIDDALTGRSKGPEGTRISYTGDNALATLIAKAYRDKFSADFGIINSGGVRSDLPPAVAPNSTAPYQIVRGDCKTISPFGSKLLSVSVTGADLWNIAQWIVSSRAGEINAHFYGIDWSATTDAQGGATVHSMADYNQQPIVNDTTQVFSLALSEYLAFGGDGFPATGGTVSNVADNEAICDFLSSAPVMTDEFRDHFQWTRASPLLSPGEIFVQGPAQVTIGELNSTAKIQNVPVQQFSVALSQLSSIGSVSNTNPYAIVYKGNRLAGQLSGDPASVTVDAPVQLCLRLRPTLTKSDSRYDVQGMAALRGNGWSPLDVSVTTTDTQVCATVGPRHNGVVIAPARLAPSSVFSTAELGVMLALASIFAVILIISLIVFIPHVITEHRTEKIHLLNSGNIIRLSVVLICLLRAVYFFLEPWGVLDSDRVAGTFLFELPFALDLTVSTCILQLFITVFTFDISDKQKSALRLNAPLLIMNAIVFASLIAVLIAWGATTSPLVRNQAALAYRIILVVMVLLILIGVLYFGARMFFLLIYKLDVLKSGGVSAKKWGPQLKRFGVMMAATSAGLLGLAIVLLYTTTRPDNPTTNSIGFVVGFLFVFEVIPFLILIVDLQKAIAKRFHMNARRDKKKRGRLGEMSAATKFSFTSGTDGTDVEVSPEETELRDTGSSSNLSPEEISAWVVEL